MRGRIWRTAEVAREVGVHPNTVRLYEAWGFLPDIPRSPSGYRLFTERHVDLMRLARTALHFPYPGGKEPVLGLVRRAVEGDLEGALELAHRYAGQIDRERAHAEAAADLLRRWARGDTAAEPSRPRKIGETARLLGITVDALRNWERNGLVSIPQDPSNRYRAYGRAEIDRLQVIRVLRSAGFSIMAILRMLRQLDEGTTTDPALLLDTPGPGETEDGALYFTDRWLSTLAEQRSRADELIAQLERMIRKG